MLLNAKTLKIEKVRLFELQKGMCPLCGHPLNSDIYSNHLDHDHILDGPKAGKVRGLLCNICNGAEGQIRHKFNRSGLLAKDADLADWLRKMADYIEADTSNNPIHPNFVPDKVKKFSRLNKTEMINELQLWSIEYSNTMGKDALIKAYRTGLRKKLKEQK